MVLKQIENLSRYAVDETGAVIEIATGEELEKINKTQYRLQTDEQVSLPATKKVWNPRRRFTSDDLASMYKSPKATVYDYEEEPSAIDKFAGALLNGSVEDVLSEIKRIYNKNMKAKKSKAIKAVKSIYVHNGVDYPSANALSKELKISINTVIKKAKAGTEGFAMKGGE